MKHIRTLEGSAIAVVFVIALAVRLIYVAQAAENPFSTVLMFDSKLYEQQAEDLIAQGPLYGGVYLLGPLYVYFLAATRAIIGDATAGVMATQAVLGAMACAMVCGLGGDLFDKKTGLTAGLVSAVYGPLVFYSGVILAEPVLVFINTALVCLLVKAYAGGQPKTWLMSGIVMGVSAWGKSNILVLAPIILALELVRPGRKGPKWGAAWLIIGVLLAVAPITARNMLLGSLVPVTGNLGVNLYIGNNPNATGTFTPLNELMDSSGGAYYIDTPDTLGGRQLYLPDADSALRDRSLAYIIGHPLDWTALMFRKLMLYLNAYEIPDMEDYDFMRGQSILGWLIPSMSIIAPLGILGMLMNIRRWQTWPATAYVLAYGFSFILFFVKARFRIALMPVIILFAADAFWRLAGLWKTNRRLLARQAAALILLWAIVNNPHYKADIEGTGMYNPYNNLGREYASRGDMERATEYYEKAIVYSPGQYEPYNNLGEAYNKAGEYGKAEETLRKAVELDPGSPYAHNNLGTALYNLGRLGEAEAQYKAAIAGNRHYYEARSNLGITYIALNRTDEAIAELEAAAKIEPQDQAVIQNLETAYAMAGKR